MSGNAGSVGLNAPVNQDCDGYLVDPLAAFRVQYPAVRFDLDLSIATRDLVAEGFDFAIRIARTMDPSLVARPLGMVREAIVAGPAYLAAHAPDGVKEPKDLSPLEALRNRNVRDEGRRLLQCGEETIAVPVQGNLAINHFIGLRRAAVLGLGVARLPRYLLGDELERGTLLELLSDWHLPSTPISLVYPARGHMPMRAHVLRDPVLRWAELP